MTTSSSTISRPGIFRYIAVMIYDLFLLIAILLLAGLIAVTLNGGQAIGEGNPFFLIYLLAVSYLFYGWFWTHGGQTLGMRSWKVQLHAYQGEISWKHAFLRFSIALVSWMPFGLGFWWQYLAKDNHSWPDMISGTYLVYAKDSKNKPLSRLS